MIASKKKESATVAARYEADRQRFIELRNGQPSGAVVTSSDGRYSATQPAGIKLSRARAEFSRVSRPLRRPPRLR